MGAPKKRGTTAAAVASNRKPTATSLAHRLDQKVHELGFTVDPVHINEMRTTFRRWHNEGTDLELIAAMVDVFCGAPRRYMKGDELPWRAFYNAREKLRVDGLKRIAARQPASERYALDREKLAEVRDFPEYRIPARVSGGS